MEAKESVKDIVKKGYSEIAKNKTSCCSCGCEKEDAKAIGYSSDEIESVPGGSNMGLGCGNPTAIASLKEGEIVLDLGSGAGFDAFLAAKKVGSTGKVIGVDMTPEMIEKAIANARRGKYSNVEFRVGEIENLPLADDSIDVVISNCVINLSPDKDSVFKEAYRVLKEGGRMFVSDMVKVGEIPEEIKKDPNAWCGCIAGTIEKEEYVKKIKNAGFSKVEVVSARHSGKEIHMGFEGRIESIVVKAVKDV